MSTVMIIQRLRHSNPNRLSSFSTLTKSSWELYFSLHYFGNVNFRADCWTLYRSYCYLQIIFKSPWEKLSCHMSRVTCHVTLLSWQLNMTWYTCHYPIVLTLPGISLQIQIGLAQPNVPGVRNYSSIQSHHRFKYILQGNIIISIVSSYNFIYFSIYLLLTVVVMTVHPGFLH